MHIHIYNSCFLNIKPTSLHPGDLDLLFGENCEVMEAFAQLDTNQDGEVRIQQL